MQPTKTEKIENLDISKMNREIKLIVLKFPTEKNSGPDSKILIKDEFSVSQQMMIR